MGADRPGGGPPRAHGGADREAPAGERLPASSRIRSTREIRALFARGKRRKTRHLDVFHAVSPVSRPRWGVVVPKHRHDIVQRNKLRRRLRDIGRRVVLPVLWRDACALDVMVRARPEAYRASYEELRAELREITEELCSAGPSSS